MDLPHLMVIDRAESFLKQHVPFFRPFAAGSVFQNSTVEMLQTVARWVREQSSSDGKRRLSWISRIPPRDSCLITAGALIAEATKLIFTTFSLISLTREQVLHCGDWRHPSGAARAASGWISALKHWGWFIPCKMQVADINSRIWTRCTSPPLL